MTNLAIALIRDVMISLHVTHPVTVATYGSASLVISRVIALAIPDMTASEITAAITRVIALVTRTVIALGTLDVMLRSAVDATAPTAHRTRQTATYTHCQTTFETKAERQLHQKKCTAPRAYDVAPTAKLSPLEVDQRTCGFCNVVFKSRNKLFTHISTYEATSHVATYTVLENDTPRPMPLVPQALPVISTPDLTDDKHTPVGNYTHLRVKARPSPNGQEVDICLDLGAGRTVISRSFLQQLEHTVVDEDFGPAILISNDLLKPHSANINYDIDRITFTALDDFTVEFDVNRRSQACLRKVTSRETVTVPPSQSAYIIAEYKSLPTDRCFYFDAKHPAALHAVVDAKTPHGKATKAIGVVAAAATAATLTLAPSSAASNPPSTKAVTLGSEFDITPNVTAILTGYTPPVGALADAFDTDSTTPLTDAVFALTDASIASIEDDKPPRFVEPGSALGIKKPVNITERVLDSGIHVYAESASFANDLANLTTRYPKLWVDQRTINVPVDQQMKIPLVKG
ncbi:PR domain zinc finger protein 5 [Microdochium nivale]|nr:PR domain zinc finger protein 5 [Microdochium nivale]